MLKWIYKTLKFILLDSKKAYFGIKSTFQKTISLEDISLTLVEKINY